MVGKPIMAVRAIIKDKSGNVLLLKRAKNNQQGGYWCLPGGKAEYGLTAQQSLEKEVKEETSLRCTRVKFFFYQDNLPQHPGESHYITLYFKCETEGEVKLNKESSTFAWIGPREIDNYEIAFQNDLAIKKYWENQKFNKHI